MNLTPTLRPTSSVLVAQYRAERLGVRRVDGHLVGHDLEGDHLSLLEAARALALEGGKLLGRHLLLVAEEANLLVAASRTGVHVAEGDQLVARDLDAGLLGELLGGDTDEGSLLVHHAGGDLHAARAANRKARLLGPDNPALSLARQDDEDGDGVAADEDDARDGLTVEGCVGLELDEADVRAEHVDRLDHDARHRDLRVDRLKPLLELEARQKLEDDVVCDERRLADDWHAIAVDEDGNGVALGKGNCALEGAAATSHCARSHLAKSRQGRRRI